MRPMNPGLVTGLTPVSYSSLGKERSRERSEKTPKPVTTRHGEGRVIDQIQGIGFACERRSQLTTTEIGDRVFTARVDRQRALRLAIRCARDSMPPLRLAIIDDVPANPHSKTSDIRRRLNKPRNTVDRQLQALHTLGVLDCDEVAGVTEQRSTWYYDIAEGINPNAIAVPVVPEMSPHGYLNIGRERVAPDISGTTFDGRPA